jgi:uncharacterized protein YjeT (DUF2065 family)
MHWADLFAALALYLVIEGLLPFVSPSSWRRQPGELLSRMERAGSCAGLRADGQHDLQADVCFSWSAAMG